MRFNLYALNIFLLASIFSFSLFAAPVKSVLTCGTNIFPPYSILTNTKVTGLDISKIDKIAAELNIDINIEIYPWVRLLKQIENGTLDCMFAAFKTPERVQYMVFTTTPIHVSSLYLYVNKNQNMQFTSIQDLAGLTIGTIRGFALPPEIERLKQSNFFSTKEVNTVSQSFQMLQLNRIDAVIYNNHVAEYELNKMGIKNIIAISNSLQKLPAYVVFSKKSELVPLIKQFNQALEKISTETKPSQQQIFSSQ